ncbi:hypothetical protein I8748_17670 [Nostoc sp. CENA67]|uniref:DUF5331 domain-containing protein n=1 Tax=Amazonocrinis nigriterrae CENA67 TaxID=2794033 RepID=A0A8J7HV50_9NOST|nr:DUF5331 domain-containing protein [Amazonocrinis nigriterrae]MBH8563990.1 hypothetical protein [Amazonocrinis nigriterrae CENA67]
MNIQQLRQSLKLKWLSYYEQNRSWLVKMRVWGTYDGLRRPSSGFILATMSVLEAQFDEILAFIMELNNNPDEIVAALGLNFNPDEELDLINLKHSLAANQVESESLQEKPCEDKHVASVAVTQITHQSPTSALHTQKQPLELARAYKPVVSFTTNAGVTRTQKPVPAMAIVTKIAPQSLGRTPHSNKQASSLVDQNQLMRSTAALLEVTNDITINRKSVRSLEITTEVPVIAKTLPTSALATEFTVVKDVHTNGNVKAQPPDIPKKVNLSASTNARSLASWVDEFCQGVTWDRVDAISIK